MKLLLQLMPQAPLVQVGAPLVGVGQGVQEVPQLLGLVFDAQVLPQAWKVLLQVNPQLVPSHVAVPLVGAVGQAVQEVPQLLRAVFKTHAVPHK